MPIQSLELKNFEVIESIGSGSYGQCKKVRRKSDGKIFAWKEIDYSIMSDKEKRMLTNEVHALRNLRHPYILSYIGQIVDNSNKILYIVTEYCVGGDLLSLVNKHKKAGTSISEDFIWKVLWQLLFAFWQCHDITKRGTIILHRDVKPANVFLTGKRDIKLGDFGLARMLPSDSAFMSPEIIGNRNYNDKSDIWGLGCLIYQLCALTPPFYAADIPSLERKILGGKFNRIPSKYSNELEYVIRKMLTLQADKRPSADVIINLPVVTTLLILCRPKSWIPWHPKTHKTAAEMLTVSANKCIGVVLQNVLKLQQQGSEAFQYLSMSSTNGSRNTLKHVCFQDIAHPDKVKIQEKPYLEDDKSMPAIRSTKKENFLSVVNGPSVKLFQELKTSLTPSNRGALKLRMAEMETRMILSPFI